jgi:putative aldouronate transport system substrate-binding protein
MKTFKRLTSVALAAMMGAGLAACGFGGGNATSGSGSSSEAASGNKDDVVTLKWYAVGSGMPDNYDSWAQKVNDYLADKIGVNIDMNIISWGDWESRRNVIVSTASDYDILFTNLNTYTNDVETGAFLDLTDLLDKDCPELMKLIPENYWDACRINGKIYAIPTYKDSSVSQYLVWDNGEAKALGYDNVADIHELDDATPVLQAETDAKSEASFPMYQTAGGWQTFEYDSMGTGLPAIGVRYNDESGKVVPVFEQDDVMSILNTLRSWYQSGIINSDAATKPGENTGYRFCNMAQGWSGAAKTSWGPQMGVEDMVASKWGPTIVSNETVRGSLNCISSGCKNPDKALQFLDLLNSDTWLRDMFYYGEQGVDWDYTSDNKVHRIKTDWSMAGYTQATFFNVSQTDDVDFNQWDEVKELNENAEPSVLLGFTLDTSKFSDKLTNCISIFNNYKSEVMTGTVDPAEGVENMMNEMRAAGFDDILTESQAQVDAFLASK